MNRRSFIEAAAVSTMAVLQTGARPRVTRKPVEVDIIDPVATEYLRDESVDVFARLEEADPADPGQLSGCSLRIMNCGSVQLRVDIDANQRDGSRHSHCLGEVDDRDLSSIADADLANEADSFSIPAFPAGVFLVLAAGAEPEMSVCIRAHCLGVLRGRALAAFLGCLRTRCELAQAAA
jgi:hypothetical protein